MKQTRLIAFGTAGATVAAVMSLPYSVVHGQTALPPIPPFAVCSRNVNIASFLPGGAKEDPEVATAASFITLTEQSLLQQVAQASSLDLYHQITLLGKTEIYDVSLSPLGDAACATCHASYTGFRGSTSLFNATTAAQPGGVPITNAVPPGPNFRIGPRNPPTYSYAPFVPILHYNATQNSFYGGNFWDMRATGIMLTNPAAEQAQGPPVNPVEMGNIDTACVVWKASLTPYASLITLIWGANSFAINWPPNVAAICATPGPPPANNPFPVQLSDVDRGQSNSTYGHMTMAMASYETSADVSPFSSKFDAYLAGNAALSATELAGYTLFNGKAGCNQCHLSGNATGPLTGVTADVAPLFTDFTANNIGLPQNLALPYYCESTPDQFGYTANPLGFAFVDLGVGAFLNGTAAAPNPNTLQWKQLAPFFNGTFKTATLRNVDKRPTPTFIKEYMHNGYLKSLKEVVHFYNTSQALPRCAQGSVGEKVTCWPVPEYPATLNTTQLGNLGLTSTEEDEIVAFLQTLTDGFVTSPTTLARPAIKQ
jgi:cytochrome c peroxidase